MKPVAVYDIETENWTTFVCGGLLDVTTGEYKEFSWREEEQYVDAILSIKGEVYAHNGGRFDHLWLLDHAVRRGIQVRMFASAGAIIRAEFASGTKLCDSARIFPMSLRSLTNGAKTETGLPCRGESRECQQAIEDNGPRGCGGYCNIRRTMSPEYYKRLTGYMEQDCRTLVDALNHFSGFAEANGIEVGLTIGATAWRTAKSAIGLPSVAYEPRDFKFIRKGYYGGRCQLFKDNALSGYQYDVNSMYPAMLSQRAVPTGNTLHVRGKEARLAFLNSTPGIYSCRVCVPEMHIPPLPLRTTKRMNYPIGEFEGIWAFPELEYAVSLGCEVFPYEAVIFEREEILFTDWINKMFDLRSKYGKKSREGQWVKAIMNSLTGKFGSNPEKENIIINPHDYDKLSACEGGRKKCRLGGKADCGSCCKFHCSGFCRRVKSLCPGEYIFIKPTWHIDDCAHAAWAAYLTAGARITLHKQLVEGQNSGRDALYCDTDSVFSEFPRVSNVGAELGQWSFEGEFTDFSGHAPKVYSLTRDNKLALKAKGIRIPEGKVQETLDKIVTGVAIESENMIGAKLSAREGDTFFRRGIMSRHLSKGFGDRKETQNGNTRPPHISEVEKYG
jgi:hypothetical protein